MHENILKTIGNTPLVKLSRIGHGKIFAKIESRNPGGSVKDRIALAMVDDAEKKGLLKENGTIIEPTSGNTGIGLAMVAAAKGYKAIFTMPESMSLERRKILVAFGAELILTPKERGMTGAVEKARELSLEKGYVMLQQFENHSNPEVHERTTGPEIEKQLEGIVPDFFVVGAGTGGTVTGAGRYLKKRFPSIKVIAVEPDESAVLSGEKPGPHKIQGIGPGFVPKILDRTVIDSIIRVKGADAIHTAQLLMKEEGIFAGISSGAACFAARELSKSHPTANIVTVFPDTGERYLSTELMPNV